MNTQALPIFKVIPQIKHALTQGHNIILQAEPGAGKSTVVPLEIIKGGMFDDRKIIMLQPRRVAAKSIAHFLASALGEKVGQTVGYRVRNESKVSTMTKLEIVTEGILTQMIQHDPELSGIGLIIFDEFHERSLHADLSLMLAKEVQQSLREDMVLLVMSATIDARELESYMQNTHTISVEGRVFPVELEYQSIKHKTLESGVVSAVKTFIHQTSGDVLVFLPGVKEISTCLNVAKQSLNQDEIECLALHGALPLKEQQRVLRHAPLDKRKVVFSTNIAETSLTLPNITGVVDSGLERKLHYDPNSGMSRLLTKRISLASAEQRKGRAGRVQAGKCIRLWSASENRSFEKYHLPEILNAELTDVVLQLAKWGNLHFGEIDWITAPPKAHFDSAMTLLTSLDLLSNSGAITQLGLEVSEIGLPVRLAKTIVMTTSDQHRAIACRLAAMLSEKDVLISSESADLMLRYQVMERTMTDAQPQSAKLNVSTLKSAQILENNLFQKVRNKTFRSALQKGKVTLDSNLDPVSVIACLALFAFPERLAIRRSKNSNRYLLANGKGVCLREHDPLCQHVLLVVTDCNIKEREGLIFSAVPIEMNTLTSVFKSSLDNVKTNVFEPNTGRFFSERSLNYQSIQLESLEKADADDAFIKKTICEQLKTKAEGLLNWTEACESWVKRLIWLGSVTDDFPVFSKQNLLERADEWLLPYIGKVNKQQDLKSINILPLFKSIISWETQSILEKQAPEYYQAPSGHRVKIDYDASQGPKVSIALQEVFGELVAPKLAGKVNLRFELLSPAKRPIQITSDIGQFWHTSYFDVAKEMRAKYPKHRWPTEPLKAEAGRSIKNKRGC